MPACVHLTGSCRCRCLTRVISRRSDATDSFTGGAAAVFDQQPVEACTVTSACLAAHGVSGDACWMEKGTRAFEWFLGQNSLQQWLYDASTGGCRDGLHADRTNRNQGAEATLSFLLALCEMRAAHPTVIQQPEPALIAAHHDAIRPLRSAVSTGIRRIRSRRPPTGHTRPIRCSTRGRRVLRTGRRCSSAGSRIGAATRTCAPRGPTTASTGGGSTRSPRCGPIRNGIRRNCGDRRSPHHLRRRARSMSTYTAFSRRPWSCAGGDNRLPHLRAGTAW